MTEKEAREIIKHGVIPGEIDSIDLARAKGYLEGLQEQKEYASEGWLKYRERVVEISELQLRAQAAEDVAIDLDIIDIADVKKKIEKRIAELRAEKKL